MGLLVAPVVVAGAVWVVLSLLGFEGPEMSAGRRRCMVAEFNLQGVYDAIAKHVEREGDLPRDAKGRFSVDPLISRRQLDGQLLVFAGDEYRSSGDLFGDYFACPVLTAEDLSEAKWHSPGGMPSMRVVLALRPERAEPDPAGVRAIVLLANGRPYPVWCAEVDYREWVRAYRAGQRTTIEELPLAAPRRSCDKRRGGCREFRGVFLSRGGGAEVAM